MCQREQTSLCGAEGFCGEVVEVGLSVPVGQCLSVHCCWPLSSVLVTVTKLSCFSFFPLCRGRSENVTKCIPFFGVRNRPITNVQTQHLKKQDSRGVSLDDGCWLKLVCTEVEWCVQGFKSSRCSTLTAKLPVSVNMYNHTDAGLYVFVK